ncbi:class II glutamine amidotransferase [Oscillospiraceae bacterium PP1C4]
MCGLFGMFDCENQLTPKQRNKILCALARESEIRGQDATGIAYLMEEHLHIYKRPLPAHKMRFAIPQQVNLVMGHTRAATQGSQKKWQNNHPFYGTTEHGGFAFAHNGVLWNDNMLRIQKDLPSTDIETDSYVAVQLLEQKNALNLNSLASMAEQVEGTFTFTVLDKDGLYFVKGDSPICIYYSQSGVYFYASTEEILKKALERAGLHRQSYEKIEMDCGDILHMDMQGDLEWGRFDMTNIMGNSYLGRFDSRRARDLYDSSPYFDDLYAYARNVGVSDHEIDTLLDYGLDEADIEELLYDPMLLSEYLHELRWGDYDNPCYAY